MSGVCVHVCGCTFVISDHLMQRTTGTFHPILVKDCWFRYICIFKYISLLKINHFHKSPLNLHVLYIITIQWPKDAEKRSLFPW